jgi:dCMP deaminase
VRRARPEMPAYFMGIAIAVRARADCRGSRVGAVIARDDRIVSTGYNGTPSGMTNCSEGGCLRCAHPERYGPGKAYDLCICVHAEQNALLAAARFGIEVQGATLYTTMQPCFGCAKELLQARIAGIHYLHPWEPGDPEKRDEYRKLLGAFRGNVHHLPLDDPDAAWAVNRERTPAVAQKGGHQVR